MARWIILWMLLTCVYETSCQAPISFFRCNNDTKIFEFVYSERTRPNRFDIYAVSRRSTCGLRSGAFTGTGVFSDPYTLAIDLGSGLNAQDPDCGVTQDANNVLHMEMVVQTECEAVSPTDVRYTSSCPMVVPGSGSKTSRMATYTCIAPSTILFTFEQQDPGRATPFDIYAMDNRATCSRMGVVGTGTGGGGSPYTLRIDVNTMATQCGVTTEGPNVYSALIYVQQYASILTVDDILYSVQCDFAATATIGIETVVNPAVNRPPTIDASQNQPKASLSVVTASGDALTSLTVGDPIRLVAQLTDGPAVGLRVTSCQASPAPGEMPVLNILDDKGCSLPPLMVPPFIGQAPTGSVAMTNAFKAFKFDNSDTVYFSCQTRPCYDSDLSCLGNHCDDRRRRKREAASRDMESQEVGILIVVRESNAGNSTRVHRVYPGITTTNRDVSHWPLSALVTSSTLAAACGFLILIILGVLLRFKRAKQ